MALLEVKDVRRSFGGLVAVNQVSFSVNRAGSRRSSAPTAPIGRSRHMRPSGRVFGLMPTGGIPLAENHRQEAADAGRAGHRAFRERRNGRRDAS